MGRPTKTASAPRPNILRASTPLRIPPSTKILIFAFHRCGNLRQNLGRSRGVIQHPAPMVGNDDPRRTGLNRQLRIPDRHDPFEDHRKLGPGNGLLPHLHGPGTCRLSGSLHVNDARRIDVRSNGGDPAGLGPAGQGQKSLLLAGFEGRNPPALNEVPRAQSPDQKTGEWGRRR